MSAPDIEKLRAQATDDERLALARAERRDIADLEATRDLIRGARIDSPIERNYARIVRAAERSTRCARRARWGCRRCPTRSAGDGAGAFSLYADGGPARGGPEGCADFPGEAALAGRIASRVLAHRLSALAGIDDPYASRTPADAFLQKMTDTGSSGSGVRIFADMQKSLAPR